MIYTMLAESSLRREQLQSLEERFTSTQPDTGWKLIVILAALLAVLIVFVVINFVQKRKMEPMVERPQLLFFHAMRKMKLPFKDRYRLWCVAGALQIEHPTAMLISPTFYDASIHDYCSKEGFLGSREPSRPALQALRERVFGSYK